MLLFISYNDYGSLTKLCMTDRGKGGGLI